MQGTRRAAQAAAIAILVACCLVAAGCSSANDEAGGEPAPDDAATETTDPSDEETDADDVVFPGDEWQRADPEDLGFDAGVLEEIAADVQAQDSNCLVVTRRGQIVGEWYWQGTDADTAQEVFSATKSFTSTLVGIAQDQGALDIDEPASTYIDEWAGTPSEGVTIKNLLSNDSGRQWSLLIDYVELVGAPDKNEFAIGLGQDHEPGQVWAYNNAAIQTLDAVVQRATGEDTATFAHDHLLEPIGMDDSRMTLDAAGNALAFMGLQSSCEDMARFGYLFLRDGRWDDEQVVSAEWVQEATSPSQELTPSYGYLWWLNNRGTQVDPALATEGPPGLGQDPAAPETTAADQADEADDADQVVVDAPESMFWARGLGGQIVAIDPGSETVVVRLGPSGTGPGAARFDASVLAELVTRALVAP